MACQQAVDLNVPQPLPTSSSPVCPGVTHPIGWELAIGAGLALIVLAIVVGWRRPSLAGKLPGAATFSAKDSWATNLTALVAGVGAIAAVVSDKFPDVVDKQSILEFSVGAALLALVATFAPVAYVAVAGAENPSDTHERGAEQRSGETSPRDEPPAVATDRLERGTKRPSRCALGLLLASFLTLTASFGALAGIPVVAVQAHLTVWTKASIWIATAAGGVLIALYAVRALRRLLLAAAQDEDFTRLVGLVVVSCCGSDATTRVRIALL